MDLEALQDYVNPPDQRATNRSLKYTVATIFVVQLLAMLLLSFFPHLRTWGLAPWDYLPIEIRIIFPAVGMTVGASILWSYWPTTKYAGQVSRLLCKRTVFWVLTASLAGSILLVFFAVRPSVFLLGDGYEVIALLSQTDPVIKSHEMGAVLLHLGLMKLLNLEGTVGATVAVQVASVIAGILFLLICCGTALKLFERKTEALLYSTCMLVGGYSLLFFGYVENYAFFVVSVLFFTQWGLLSSEKKGNKWYLIPIVGFSISFHVLGVSLIPALLYLLISPTMLGKTIRNSKRITKALLIILVLLATGLSFAYAYSDSAYIRYAILPLVASEFSPDKYGMFSLSHLLDIANLLILLCPGLLLFLVVITYSLRSLVSFNRAHTFLAILSVSTIGASFIFDPKLGMARDWDLFSYCGVPLSSLMFFTLIKHPSRSNGRLTMLLAVTLSLVVLISRAETMSSESMSISQFHDYALLDKQKNRNAWTHLIKHYLHTDNEVLAEHARTEWDSLYPERVAFDSAYALKEKHLWSQATVLFRKAASFNPSYPDAWSNLGELYVKPGKYDSAVVFLRRALRLNPFEYTAYNNLGTALLYLGEYDDAISNLKSALKLFPGRIEILYNLASAYRLKRDRIGYKSSLLEAAQAKNATAQVWYEVGILYIGESKYPLARQALANALARGLDTQVVADLEQKVPQLVLSGRNGK